MKNIIKTITIVLSTLFVSEEVLAKQAGPDAKLNLVLSQPETNIQIGEEFEIPLMVEAATEPQRYVVADIVFSWNPEHVQFLGISHVGSHPLIWTAFSGLPYCQPGQASGCGDYYGLNELPIPQDGNGLYFGYNILGSMFIVSNPVQIVRFKFKALSSVSATEIKLLPEYTVYHTAKTIVYGGNIPGLGVTGTLTNAIVTVVPANISGDLDGNGFVGPSDMALLLANWGSVSFGENPFDIDGDGIVGAGDLTILIANWNQ
jgi:hypothetical protein